MIVEKSISVRIRGGSHFLKQGQTVPQSVIDFWNESGQLVELLKSGAISDPASKNLAKKEKVEVKSFESVPKNEE